MDLFMERQVRDGGNDVATSRALSREINDLERNRLSAASSTMNARDRVSFASASLVLGPQFMIFGLGAALMEEFSAIKQEKQLMELQRQQRGLKFRRPGEKSEDEQLKTLPDFKSSLAGLGADMFGQRITGKRLTPKDKDQKLGFEKFRNMRPYLSVGKDWLDVRRLVKRKQFLLDQLERMNNRGHLSAVSALLAKVELLDKALKRLGC